MRKALLLGAAVPSFFLVGCSSSGSSTCGSGTALEDGTCEVTVTCGSGTVLSGSTCVATSGNGGSAAAPTISAIDPTTTGVAGKSLFTITGTGFVGDNVTSLTVYFGDTTNTACAATLGAANATTIAGEVPPACSLSTDVKVTVTTNVGSATVPFQYEALFAADGDADPDAGMSYELYVIDPVIGMSFDVGTLATGSGSASLSGLAFTSAGALYGVTTGDSPADTAKIAQLVTIDLKAGAVTAVGELKDGSGNAYTVSDMKFNGSTLYAWGYTGSGNSTTQGLISINTTSAAVTVVGTPAASSGEDAGLAIDTNGTAYVAANAAGSTLLGASGALDTLDMTNGAPTAVATLDWPWAAPIHSMDYVGTTLMAVVDDGLYSQSIQGLISPAYGEELVVINPSASPNVSAAFAAPALVGAESHVSALATAPATLTIDRAMPREGWSQLAAGVAPAPTGK